MKILVIYATAGAGHRKAAEAIFQQATKLPAAQVKCLDVLEFTSPIYKALYSQVYTFLIIRTPWLWGFFFKLLDIKALQPVVRFLRRVQNTIHAHALAKHLIDEQYDYIFSTHFLPNEVAGYLKRTGKITAKIICAITDYDVHRIWLAKGIDLYAVATLWTAEKLKGLDVPAEQVVVTGIPVDEKFSAPKDLAALRKSLGLKEGMCTVLIATGSFGIGPIEEILMALEGFQIIVVCGHNKNLYEKLSSRAKEGAKICGLVNNMDELMAVSDVMVTKPGGLSISEALVTGLPLVFFSAIPGQETNNVEVLSVYNVGSNATSVKAVEDALTRLKDLPGELQLAKDRAKSLGKPLAARDIITLVA